MIKKEMDAQNVWKYICLRGLGLFRRMVRC